MTVDWAGLEHEMVAALVRTVESAVADSPDRRFYAAALDRIYREIDGVITLPNLGMNCEEALARLPVERQSDIRWSPADWEFYFDDWFPSDRARDWESALTAE